MHKVLIVAELIEICTLCLILNRLIFFKKGKAWKL